MLVAGHSSLVGGGPSISERFAILNIHILVSSHRLCHIRSGGKRTRSGNIKKEQNKAIIERKCRFFFVIDTINQALW